MSTGEPSIALRLVHLDDGSSSWKFDPFQLVAIGPNSAPLTHNSVLVVPAVLTHTECDQLVRAADRWLDSGAEDEGCLRGGDEQEPLRRVRVSRMDASARALVERVLKGQVLPLLEAELPAAAQALFGDGAPLCEMAIRFAAAEPVVSRYTAGGALFPHEDLEALTVLIPLSSHGAYEGGGTAFWADGCARHPDGHPECGTPVELPSCVLKPPRGSAMLYGGDLLHAAAEVTSGVRHICVCSFSPLAPHRSAGGSGGASNVQHAAAPHESRWGETRRRGRIVLNEQTVWTDLQGAFG
jgi:hypothetical protein